MIFKQKFINNYQQDIEILYDIATLQFELNIQRVQALLNKYKEEISTHRSAAEEIKNLIKELIKYTINNSSTKYINHMYQYFSEEGLINIIYVFINEKINNYISSR